MNKIELRRYLAEQAESYRSQRQLALHLGLSPQYLNDVILGFRPPGKKLLDAIGFRCVVTEDYQPVGKIVFERTV